MEREKIILDHSETCDACGKTISAGEPVYPLYDTNCEQPNISLEEIRTEWILSFCSDCIGQVADKPDNQNGNE